MTGAALASQRPWRDKFRQPTPEQLLTGYAETEGELALEARAVLGAVEGVSEEVSWQGVPWRWSFVYRLEGDPTEAFAYLVPADERALLSLPLSVEMVDRLAEDKVKRTVRADIMHARFVGGVYWPTWEVGSKAQLGELAFLVERKARSIRSRTTP